MSRSSKPKHFGLVALSLLVLQLSAPALTLATAPGPPNVDVVPPEAIMSDRDGEPVTFVPGLITFTYADGNSSQCVIDPAAPPNPCSELATTPGPPDIEVLPPEAILDADGGVVGFEPGLILITFDDGSQRSCVIDPTLPPNPCSETTR